jgi:hypothetical protein
MHYSDLPDLLVSFTSMKALKRSTLFALGIGTNWDLPTSPSLEFTYEQLYTLLPYADVSVRGAILGLKEERLVSSYQRAGMTRMSLTAQGRETLRLLFPAFRPTDTRRELNWTFCLFLPSTSEARSYDEKIRTTRSLLLSAGFFHIDKGIYVYPKSVPEQLRIQLAKLQVLSDILVVESRRFIIGDERQVLREVYDVESYSKKGKSVLETLDTIGGRLAENKRVHPQTRQSFVLLLPKLMELFVEDLSLLERYFPQDIRLSYIKQLYYSVGEKLLLNVLTH